MIPIPEMPGKRGTRMDRVGMIRPMGEAWTPRSIRWPEWIGGETVARRNRLVDLLNLVVWLDVEDSIRWRRNDRGGTYCDHYAADFWSQWLGHGEPVNPPLAAWLWWTKGPGPVVYGETVRELGATGLYDWLDEHATAYGWRSFRSESELRAWCESTARPGLIIARTKGVGASHVAVALPDSVERAARARGVSVEPGGGMLTTEAGGRNRRLTRRTWWRGAWAGVLYLGRAD